MRKLFIISILFLSSSKLFANNNSNRINDTSYTENDIRVYYKLQNTVDSIYIFDKKFKLKERGYINGNMIKFFNEKKDLTAVGGFYDNNLQGNFLYFKDDKLYKTANMKNGKEEGIALIFDKDGYLDLLYESVDGKKGGLSLLFENHLPKYIRTDEINSNSVTMVEFCKDGKIQSISFPNDNKIEEEAQRATSKR
jgi:hypothetical protein